MVRFTRKNYTLKVYDGIAYMIRNEDQMVVFSVSDPISIEALIDCFTEDMAKPA